MNDLYSDLVTLAGNKIQKTDSTYATNMIKPSLNKNYERLWRRYLWRQSIVFDEAITVTSGTATVALPKTVEEILIFTDRTNGNVIVPMNVQILMRKFLQEIATAGVPTKYTPMGEFGVSVQPTAAATIRAQSSVGSGADTTRIVRIWGKSGGEERTDTIALNGNAWVSSLLQFTEIHRVSKDAASTGVITIADATNAGNPTLATMAPHENLVRYPWIRLHYVPNTTQTNYLTYKKRFVELSNDSDIIEIPVTPILVDLTYADCLWEQRQFQKSEAVRQHAEKDLMDFISEQESQADKLELSMPEVILSNDDQYLFGS